MEQTTNCLDSEGLIARLSKIFHDTELYKKLVGCQGPGVQKMLDSFQQLLDMPELDNNFRRGLIVATQRISKKSGLYPTCYKLKGITIEGQHPINAGGFADIFKGDFEGHSVCLKAIRLYQNRNIEHFLKQLSKEAVLWGQLSHPNLLPVYGLFHFQNRVCLVSPWMSAGDITQYLRSNPEVARLPLVVDVAEGLSYLHKNGIVHGDLKGSNILVNDAGIACLADFGLSSVSDQEIPAWTSQSSAASRGGSVRWQAPELFDMENDTMVKNSTASDVYAWSLICYEVFAGDIPFSHIERDATVMFQVKFGARPTKPADSTPPWRSWGLTEDIWSIMKSSWKADPTERPAIDDIIRLLRPHPVTDVRLGKHKGFLSPVRFRGNMGEPLNMMSLSDLDELLECHDAPAPPSEDASTSAVESGALFDYSIPNEQLSHESQHIEPPFPLRPRSHLMHRHSNILSSRSLKTLQPDLMQGTSHPPSFTLLPPFQPEPQAIHTSKNPKTPIHPGLPNLPTLAFLSTPPTPICFYRNSRDDVSRRELGPTRDFYESGSVISRPSSPAVHSWAVPPRVLLVDDDAVSRNLSSKFLQMSGCIVDFAVDGIGAVSKMNLEKYDLVLMDIVMPKLDGVSATSLIRKFDYTTPIISMTSNSKPNKVLTYYSSGMNDILPKPFTKECLLFMLEKHLMHPKMLQHDIRGGSILRSVTLPILPEPLYEAASTAIDSDAVSIGTNNTGSDNDWAENTSSKGHDANGMYTINRDTRASSSNTRQHSRTPSQSQPQPSKSKSMDDSQPKRQKLQVGWSTFDPGSEEVPPRVLVVDDDAVSRKLSSKLLQILGCIIDIAVDGVTAVDKMRLEKYDIVLMDIVMPKLDGVSATSLIREFDHMTPIISMTSNFNPDEITTYYSSGMNDILPKPFTKGGLLDMLEKHLMDLEREHVQESPFSSSFDIPSLSGLSLESTLVQ